MKQKEQGPNHLYTLLYQSKEEGMRALHRPRETRLHSSGDRYIDEYIGGGFGRCISAESKINFRRVGDKTWNNPIAIKNLYLRTHGFRGPTGNFPIEGPIEVLGFNEQSKKIEWHKVKEVYKTGIKKCIRITVKNSYGRQETLVCSLDHPLYTLNGYVEAKNIREGYQVAMCPKGKEASHLDTDHSMKTIMWGEVTDVEEYGDQEVYDIACEGTHNFFANRVAVHNCNAYEIVMIYGTTGVNKSTFATQLVVNPALKGQRIAYFSLEDDRDDLWTRLYRQAQGMVGKFESPEVLMDKITKQILIAADSDGYTLDAMAREIENLFLMGMDIIVVDPLQFIFEASVVEKMETEFNRQRLFMRQINNLIKRAVKATGKAKTLILVSHTNKGSYDDSLDSIMGSGANKQVPTKIIEIARNKDGTRKIHLRKSRFTDFRVGPHQVTLDKDSMLIKTIPAGPSEDPAVWREQMLQTWRGGNK